MELNGRVLRQIQVQGTFELAVDQLPTGIYWVRILDDQGKTSVKRLVVE